MPLSVTTQAPSAGEETCSGVDRLLAEPPSPADSRTESPAPPLSPCPNSGQPPPLAQPLQTQAAPGVGGILSTVSNFSVINYGKGCCLRKLFALLIAISNMVPSPRDSDPTQQRSNTREHVVLCEACSGE
uniref:Uncharacterized protein n=1 Tax=Anopheles melas TaxID=34690 RepID=A0A182UER8_9DIPT